jgi:hypothetical protein
MKIKKDEYIVCCYAKSYSGPGWRNQLFVAIIRDREENIREEAIQPEEWQCVPELCAIFSAFESL